MRLVLPGGAKLGGSNRGGNERPVACRPRAGVVEASRTLGATGSEPAPVSPADALGPAQVADRQPGEVGPARVGPTATAGPVPDPPRPKFAERLSTVKLLLELLAVLVGLIGAILALFGGLRK
jgi:hypothetical protein